MFRHHREAKRERVSEAEIAREAEELARNADNRARELLTRLALIQAEVEGRRADLRRRAASVVDAPRP